MICPVCGSEIAGNHNFCPECGVSLRGAAQVVTETYAKPEKYPLTFIRDFKNPDDLENIEVYVDGEHVASLVHGDVITVQAEKGTHEVMLELNNQIARRAINVPGEREVYLSVSGITSTPSFVAENELVRHLPDEENSYVPADKPGSDRGSYQQNVYNHNVYVNNVYMGRPKNKWIAFLLCFFGGIFGFHKFYEGRIGRGLLYLFTGGLIGIGWLVDCIILLCKPETYYVK